MKMVFAVFRESLEEEVVGILQEFHVKAYTLLSKVAGTGETGLVKGASGGHGWNAAILTAMQDEQAGEVGAALKRFHDDLAQGHQGKASLHVFEWTCTQIV